MLSVPSTPAPGAGTAAASAAMPVWELQLRRYPEPSLPEMGTEQEEQAGLARAGIATSRPPSHRQGWKSLTCLSRRLLSARFICLLLVSRAPICLPVIWTNVDGQKQAGLSIFPSPFLLPPLHTIHCQQEHQGKRMNN